jgi:Leucine-rich repeat (LRR) protein
MDITGIDRNYLYGTLPSSLLVLPNLEVLVADHNMFTGSIPAALSEATKLKMLDLSFNRFSGGVPALNNLTALERLVLRNNRLSGSLTPFTTLPALRLLDISNNLFSGVLPVLTAFAPHLIALYTDGNSQLSLASLNVGSFGQEVSDVGSLSQDLDALRALYDSTSGSMFWIHRNGWADSGTDPCLSKWFGVVCNDVGRVTALDLRSNNLTGFLPDAIGRLSALIALDLSGNRLREKLPLGLSSLTRLRSFNLAGNFLQGDLPCSDLGALSELEYLDISQNAFSGSLTALIAGAANLRYLDLSRNRLMGSIPAALSSLSSLSVVKLDSNRFSGNVPLQLGACTSLTQLTASGNRLTGSLPDEFAQLQQLSILRLNNNRMSGTLPNTLSFLSSLVEVDLSFNSFEGLLPASWGNLPRLVSLRLNDNRLSGAVPSEWRLFNLTMTSLSLQNNQLKDRIPAWISSFPSLKALDLSNNQLFGFIPDLLKGTPFASDPRRLQLSNNTISCPIPPWMNPSVAQCSSLSCPVDWVSVDTFCVPCRPGWFRQFPAISCTRCPANVTEPTQQGPISGTACAVVSGNASSSVVKCRPCRLVSASEIVIPAETNLQLQLRRSTEKASGFGRFVYDFGVYGSGAVFTGDWVLGAPHGRGTLQNSAGMHVGMFQYGKKAGLGLYRNLSGDNIEGFFDDGNATWSDDVNYLYDGRPNGRVIHRMLLQRQVYEGEMSGGKVQGIGCMLYANGDTYLGEMRVGRRHGIGVMEYSFGGRYEGSWANDVRSGFGSMAWPSNDRYEGFWMYDAMSGNGTFWAQKGSFLFSGPLFRFAINVIYYLMVYFLSFISFYLVLHVRSLLLKGTIYNGQMQSGLRHGFGVLIDKVLGDVYVGQFVNDMKEGSGRMHYGNGDQYIGYWLNDVRHGDASIHYVDPNGKPYTPRRVGTGREVKLAFVMDLPRRVIRPASINSTIAGAIATQLLPSELELEASDDLSKFLLGSYSDQSGHTGIGGA